MAQGFEMEQNEQNLNETLEEAVLGCLIFDNSTYDEVGDSLQEDDFYNSFNRIVYLSIKHLASEHKPFDLFYVSEHLSHLGHNYQNVFMALGEIRHLVFVTKNVKSYVALLKQKTIDRKLIRIGHEIIESVSQQLEERLDKAQSSLSSLSDNTTPEAIFRAQMLPELLSTIDDRKARGGLITGLSTGFLDLDKITNGLHAGNLIVLGARPGFGKTLLAMNIADHCAFEEHKSVIIFSLEMDKNELIERSLASLTRIEANKIKTGSLTNEDYEKIIKILPRFNEDRLIIDDRSSVGVHEIRAKCRRIKREHGLDLVIIDYITLMSGDGENETLRIANISRGLKLLARDLSVPVIIISQLNRNVDNRPLEDRRPKMADLRGSGGIEQDADVVMFIYREEAYNENTPHKGIAEVIIAKHRNGALGTVYLTFNGNICRFDNCVFRPTINVPKPSPNKRLAYKDSDYD